MLMFATRRVVASAACRRLRLSCAASQEMTSSASGRIPTSAAWDTSRRRQVRSFAADSSGVSGAGGVVEVTKTEGASSGTSRRTPIADAGGADANRPSISTDESTCSHGISTDPNLLDRDGDDEEDDETEAMFVEPDACLGTSEIEWGGPRRGGRFAEPTRFGDWERKGRCTDF